MSHRRTIVSDAPARIDGAEADGDAAIACAVHCLRVARRVLVTGLTDATLEGVQAACDLAEFLGAAIDAGSSEAASPAGPVMPRVGGVTADWEELRDRADLVILWFCDPTQRVPDFATEFLTPQLPTGTPRRVLALGPHSMVASQQHIPLEADAAVAAARLLHAILLGQAVPPDNAAAAAVAEACQSLAVAIRQAASVAVVTCQDDDPFTLASWSVGLLVRAMAHERPAFAVPLDSASGPTLGNAAGAASVLTWRYAAAGGIARADRLGGDFRPAECSAAALIQRGEVDAVLAVGCLPATIEEAIASRAADLAVVRIDCRDAAPPGSAGLSIHIRSDPPAGTLLRADGRQFTVGDMSWASAATSMPAILIALRQRLAVEALS